MNKTEEKFKKFSYMVMKEAEDRKNEIIAEAKELSKETISAKEIEFLEGAYRRIQDSLHKTEKELNEKISKAILDSKHANKFHF
jgi:hypothetical protein